MVSVAIDIDGVIANSFKIYKEIAEEEGVVKPFNTAYNGIFKVKTADGENFGSVLFDKYRDHIITDVEPMDGALEAYEKFIRNDKILPYIVTARYNDASKTTSEWLKQHGFTHYQDLLFLKDKLKAPCQVIVDDKPSTVLDYIENARMGLIHDAPYNRNMKRARRVKNLDEAYNEILPYL